MNSKDVVPCFYTGQDYRRDQPAELLPRVEVRKYKALKLGKFVASGQVFLFYARMAVKVMETIWDGAPGARSILTFLKSSSYGDKLHYEIPMAGDRSLLRRHGLFRRRNEAGRVELCSHVVRVSSRIPAEIRALEFRPELRFA